LNLTRSATDVTSLETGSRLAATAQAGCAKNRRVDFHDSLNPKDSIAKAQVDTKQRILAPLNTRTRSALATTKERIEDISEPESARLTKRVLAAHVIVAPLVWIAQNLVGVGNQFESILCFWCWVYVRVQFSREFAISLLYLFVAGISRHTKNFVVIAHD
jgi:hypothetical protein